MKTVQYSPGISRHTSNTVLHCNAICSQQTSDVFTVLRGRTKRLFPKTWRDSLTKSGEVVSITLSIKGFRRKSTPRWRQTATMVRKTPRLGSSAVQILPTHWAQASCVLNPPPWKNLAAPWLPTSPGAKLLSADRFEVSIFRCLIWRTSSPSAVLYWRKGTRAEQGDRASLSWTIRNPSVR